MTSLRRICGVRGGQRRIQCVYPPEHRDGHSWELAYAMSAWEALADDMARWIDTVAAQGCPVLSDWNEGESLLERWEKLKQRSALTPPEPAA